MKQILIILTLLAANSASASQCAFVSNEEAYNKADIVFIGIAKKVVYLDEDMQKYGDQCGSKIASFDVKHILKGGSASKSIDIYSEDACVYLGAYFTQGETHIVYGFEPSSNVLWKDKNAEYQYDTTICYGTTGIK